MESINKYLKQVNLTDLYITKNICQIIKNQDELEFIKSNIFLLGFINKNNKNSLTILLENSEYEILKKLIRFEPNILNYKNELETNLFQQIIIKEEFYDFILEIIEKSNYELVLKIVININTNDITSVDLLISLININLINFIKIINKIDEFEPYNKIKKILKKIYEFGREDLTFVITKLCNLINNHKILLNILEYINPINLDIYPDKMMLTCIDYLLVSENVIVLKYLIPRINYIYFINIENNFLFNLINNIDKYNNIDKEKLISLIFEILSKSNISKIKNNKNENIFFKIFEKYEVAPNLITKYLKNINIYEENIDGITIYDIIKNKYSNFKIKIKDKKEKLYLFNFKKILEPTDTGLFNSDIVHNMIYTIIIMSKYNNLIIPSYYQSKEYNNNQIKLLNMSNNQNYILSITKLYFNYFNSWTPFIIIWRNKNNYYFDENLLNSIFQNKNNRYIYIRLSLSLIDDENDNKTRHANIILIDNVNKIVERFEPYGEMNYFNSDNINMMIIKRIAEPLNYEFKFVQPYPGFQTKSDEFNKYNKVYGDPYGFCLAWCLLYVETKILLDKEKNLKINPIDSINNYIIHKFKKDFPILEKDNQHNLYMIFIRFYGKKLDTEKNNLLKKLKIEPSILYNIDISKEKYKDILLKINKLLHKYCNKNKK